MSHSTVQREGRPPAFSYQEAGRGLFRRKGGAELHCDQAPIRKLVERFGSPLYVYSASTIRERMRAFQKAFRKVDHTVCYSVKANSNLAILRLLADMGCGFDVVSGGELERVRATSRRSVRRVVFSGVGKTVQELEAALDDGILLFNVESESELWRLAECAARMKKNARVALRVNPDVPADTHPYISTGLHQHKFGIPIHDARALYDSVRSMHRLRVAGVSVHIGSQITSMEPFAAAMERVAELVGDLRGGGHEIKYVDAGGGLGISYEEPGPPEFAEYVAAYAEAVSKALRHLRVHLLLEPGRSIVGPAGALVTSVVYVKQNNAKRFLVTDAAMNDLLRPSLYNAFHEIVPVQRSTGRDVLYDVVGPICETGDFFARGRHLPETVEGDLLAILDTGAYGMALSSNYNTRPRAAEVLVDGKSVRLIRKRETISDLLRAERT